MSKLIKDYLSFWTHAFDSNSEASRSEYVTGIVGNTVLWIILRVLARPVVSTSLLRFIMGKGVLGLILLLFSVSVLVPTLTLTMRRLNALGKNPFIGLVSLVPVVGYVLFGYLALQKDTDDSALDTDEGYVPFEGYRETTIDELADVATVEPKVRFSKSPSDIIKQIGQKLGFIRKDQIGDAKIIADEGEQVNITKADTFVKAPESKIERKGLGHKLISKNEKLWLKELRYTGAEQDAFAKNRLNFVVLSIVMAVVGFNFGGQAANGIAGIALGFGVFIVFERRMRLKREYNNYNFEKQVEFSKFMRTVVPYLMNQSDYSFYEVLNKITHRMRIEAEFKPLDSSMDFTTEEDKAQILKTELEERKASQRLFDLEKVDDTPVPIESVEDAPILAPEIKLQEEDVI